MSIIDGVLLVIAGCLAGYVLYALLRPEKF